MKPVEDITSRFSQTLELKKDLSMKELAGAWLFAGMCVELMDAECPAYTSGEGAQYRGVYQKVDEPNGRPGQIPKKSIQLGVVPDHSNLPSFVTDNHHVRGFNLGSLVKEAISVIEPVPLFGIPKILFPTILL